MAKIASAKTRSAKPASAAAPRRSWFWLQGMVCGVGAAAAPGTALVVAVLLAPAVAVYATEHATGRPIARAMMLMGAASAMMSVRTLWEHGGTLDTALDLLSDPGCALLSWTACGAAWLAGQSADILTRFGLDARAKMAIRALTAERDKLNSEWMDAPPNS